VRDQPAGGRFVTPWRLGASSALTTAAMSIVGATAPDLRVHLDVGTSVLALAFVAQMTGAVAGSWLAVAPRERPIQLAPGAAAAALGLLAAMLAPALTFLVVAMLATGVAAFVVNATSQAETMRRAGPARSAALSRFHVWGGAGAAFFPLAVAGLLALEAPWQAAFVLLAGGYIGFAVVNRHVRVAPSPGRAAGSRPPITARARWAVVVAVFGGGLQVTFPLYLASLLVDRYGTSGAVGSAAIAAYSGGMLAARAGGTALLPRFPPARQLQLAGALLLAGYATLAIAGSAGVAFVAAVLLGAGVGQLLPLGMARAAREIGDDRYATGVVFSLNSALQVAVPGIVALLLQVAGLRAALLMTFPIALAICVAVGASRRPESAE